MMARIDVKGNLTEEIGVMANGGYKDALGLTYGVAVIRGLQPTIS